MESLSNNNLAQFELWKGNQRLVISSTTYNFYIYPQQIGILGGHPFQKGTYMLRSKAGNTQLRATKAQQCGKSEFEITLEPTNTQINLVDFICKEWLT